MAEIDFKWLHEIYLNRCARDDFPLLYTSQNGRARARVRDDFPLLYLTKNCRALRARPFPLLHKLLKMVAR